MSFNKVYVFPTILGGEIKKNPYIFNLLESLSNGKYEVTNFTKKGKKGVSDLFQHLDSDLFIINWPENLASRRFGFFQVILYLNFLFLLKFKNKKIIWIMHNKQAHNSSSFFSKVCVYATAKLSTIVVTHSLEGVDYYKAKYKKDNIYSFPHPIYPNLSFPSDIAIEYDFIIWGSIDSYKNILGFLEFIQLDKNSQNYKFLICGKCTDLIYAQKINKIVNNTTYITFINDFISDEDLACYIAKSKAIIYTYNESSVLSSGALIYSLCSKKVIIGPNFGNFKELSEVGIIATYQNFHEIYGIFKTFKPNLPQLKRYEESYSWENFVTYITKLDTTYNN